MAHRLIPVNSKMSAQGENVPSRMQSHDTAEETCFEQYARIISIVIAILTFPISVLFCLKIAFEFQRAVVFRLGKLREGPARGPGPFFILPCIDEPFLVDLRTVTFDVLPQEVLTKDSVTVRLDAVVFFRVHNPISALIRVGNYKYSTMLLAQTTLRNVAGTKTLIEILSERNEVSRMLQEILDEATDVWGITVQRVEIKDVRLPLGLQRSMAAEAEANREANARKLAAEGEKKAATALKSASEIISANPVAVQLRYLQTIRGIATERSSTIIVPLPTSLAKKLLGHSSKQRKSQLRN